MLKTNYGLLKLFFLSILTLGIYPLVIFSKISNDVNVTCRKDGRHTMSYALLFFLVAPITLGIGSIVWHNNICSRIGRGLKKYGLHYSFGAGTFWG